MVYLILVILVGIPIFLIEMSLGRLSQSRPLVGFGKLANKPIWHWVGWLGVLTSLFIMFFYVMILAWIAIYGWEVLSGNVLGMENLGAYFEQTSANVTKVGAVVCLILLACILILKRGLQRGLEASTKWMMYSLFGIIIFLSIWAATLDNAMEGYRWYLTPTFEHLDISMLLTATGQLFFSVGVGMCVAFAFGSFTSKKENLISAAYWVVIMDTLIAVIAGFMIFPAIFTYGLEPDSGPNLIFITMTAAFSHMPSGNLIGGLFFILLFLAGFSSLLTNIQGIKDSVVERFSLDDNKALVMVAILVAIGSIPCIMSFSATPISFYGETFYDIIDGLTGKVMLPLGGLMIVIFGAHVVGYDKLIKHVLLGADSFVPSRLWKPIVQYVVPLLLTALLINSLMT